MRIADLCTRDVVTVPRGASAADAARLMREHHIGDVIVVEQRERRPVPVGIVTDRDIVIEVVARGVDPESLTVGDMLTGPLVTVFEGDDAHDAVWQLRRHGIRRLPVVDDAQRLVGVVTVDQLAAFLASEVAELARIPPQQRATELARRGN